MEVVAKTGLTVLQSKYTEDDIFNMLEFPVDNIYLDVGGKVFQQIVGTLMGTNCAPILADIFLYSYEAQLRKAPRGIQGEKSSKDMASSSNLVSIIRAQPSPKKGDRPRTNAKSEWDRTRCQE